MDPRAVARSGIKWTSHEYETTGLQEDRSVPFGAVCANGVDLETGTLHGAAGDSAAMASGTLPLVLEAHVKG